MQRPNSSATKPVGSASQEIAAGLDEQQHVSVRRRGAAVAKKPAAKPPKPNHKLSPFEAEMLTAWSAW
jgi:hypothetical protein